ncbi:MAG: GNAT family N-acetyltransferase [Planctomycetota bacterium]
MPEVRLSTFDDLPAILAISNWAAQHTAANFAAEPETLELWQADWRETHEMYPWFMAVDGDDVVGFAKAAPWKGRCAYHFTAEVTVYVEPNHHGRGIAKVLYQKLIPTLKAQGYCTLLAGITIPNGASERLHESFGFRRVALLERVGWKFDQWHDVGYWELVLRDADHTPGRIRPVAEVVGKRLAMSD